MTKKSFLALLMAVSLAFQPAFLFAADDVTAPAVTEVTPLKPITTTEPEQLSPVAVTALRCITLLVMRNAVRKYVNKNFGGEFELNNYVNHGLTYGLDTFLPQENESVKTKWAEFIAGEVDFVKKTKNATNKKIIDSTEWTGENLSLDNSLKMLIKAAARKQLFMPKGTEVQKALCIPVVGVAASGLEGWKPGADLDANAMATSCKFAMFGIASEAIAKDIIGGLIMSDTLPEFALNFMNTEPGMELVEKLLAQLIEDALKTGAVAKKILPDFSK